MSQSAAIESEADAPGYTSEDRSRFAGTFDRLVDSNLRLTESNGVLAASVKDLVRAVYVTLGLGIGMGALGLWSVMHAR